MTAPWRDAPAWARVRRVAAVVTLLALVVSALSPAVQAHDHYTVPLPVETVEVQYIDSENDDSGPECDLGGLVNERCEALSDALPCEGVGLGAEAGDEEFVYRTPTEDDEEATYEEDEGLAEFASEYLQYWGPWALCGTVRNCLDDLRIDVGRCQEWTVGDEEDYLDLAWHIVYTVHDLQHWEPPVP